MKHLATIMIGHPFKLSTEDLQTLKGGLNQIIIGREVFLEAQSCDLCHNVSVESNFFTGCKTVVALNNMQHVNLRTLFYLIMRYVGSNSNEFKVRFRNHKSAMLTNMKTCEAAIHYNKKPHV